MINIPIIMAKTIKTGIKRGKSTTLLKTIGIVMINGIVNIKRVIKSWLKGIRINCRFMFKS